MYIKKKKKNMFADMKRQDISSHSIDLIFQKHPVAHMWMLNMNISKTCNFI